MDVRCPQCQTLYELDARRVSTGRVTLKCSQCQHVFKFEGRLPTVQENTRRWMIRRQKAGDILYLNSFETLHEWIMKRECRKDDEISRTGNRWATLGEIPEFGPLFSVVESISALEDSTVSSIATRLPTVPERNEQPTPPSMPSAAAAAAAAAPRERVRTSLQYADLPRQQRAEDITKRVGSTGPSLPPSPRAVAVTPAPAPASPTDSGLDEDSWTVDLSPAPPELEMTTAYSSRPAKPRSSAWIWVAGLTLIAAGAALALAVQLDLLRLGPEPAKKVVTIGAPETPKQPPPPAPDPAALVAGAVDASISAAHQQNEAIWTMWHELASAPFYVALDTAYAAADVATAHVQLDDRIREARVALENGRLEHANRAFKQILAEHPRNSSAISGLGWTLHALGRSKEAADEFRRAIDINPEEGDAYIGLGTVLRRLGDEKGAYDAYDRYLGRFPRGDKASIASYQMEQLRRQLGL